MTPQQIYQKHKTEPRTPLDLLLWAYDEAIVRLEQAHDALTQQDPDTTFPLLLRAQFLVYALASGIEPKQENLAGRNLLRLYEFVLHCLGRNSVDAVAAALQVLKILREGFREVQVKTTN